MKALMLCLLMFAATPAIQVKQFNTCQKNTAKVEHDFGVYFVTAERQDVRVKVGPNFNTEDQARALLDALTLPCPIFEYDPAYDGPPVPSDGPAAVEAYREWVERFDGPPLTRDEQLKVNGLTFDPVTQHWFQNGVDVSVQTVDPEDRFETTREWAERINRENGVYGSEE